MTAGITQDALDRLFTAALEAAVARMEKDGVQSADWSSLIKAETESYRAVVLMQDYELVMTGGRGGIDWCRAGDAEKARRSIAGALLTRVE